MLRLHKISAHNKYISDIIFQRDKYALDCVPNKLRIVQDDVCVFEYLLWYTYVLKEILLKYTKCAWK